MISFILTVIPVTIAAEVEKLFKNTRHEAGHRETAAAVQMLRQGGGLRGEYGGVKMARSWWLKPHPHTPSYGSSEEQLLLVRPWCSG